MLQGVIVYFRVTDGELNVGDRVMLMNTRKEHIIDELGVLAPKPVNVRWRPLLVFPLIGLLSIHDTCIFYAEQLRQQNPPRRHETASMHSLLWSNGNHVGMVWLLGFFLADGTAGWLHSTCNSTCQMLVVPSKLMAVQCLERL